MDTSVEVAGLRLDHGVINGSGTFDAVAARRMFGDALLDQFPFSMFVSKTITPQARAGNAPPRIFETAAGMINSIGLPNKGLAGFLEQDLPQLAELPVPLCVSVMATSHGEFAHLVEAVAARDEVAALELNISCPNVESGLIVGEQAPETLSLLHTVRPITTKPLIVKLTPNVADPAVYRQRRGGGRCGRDFAHQHAEGDRCRSGDSGAVARRGTRWPLGPGDPPRGSGAGARGRRLRDDPGDRNGRDRVRRRCAGLPGGGSRRRRRRDRELQGSPRGNPRS